MYYERFSPEARRVIDEAADAACSVVAEYQQKAALGDLGSFFRRRRRHSYAEPEPAPIPLTPGEQEAAMHAMLAAQQGRGITGLGELGFLPIILAALAAAAQYTKARFAADAAKKVAKLQAEQAAAMAAIDKKIADEFMAKKKAEAELAVKMSSPEPTGAVSISPQIAAEEQAQAAKESEDSSVVPLAVGAGALALMAFS